MKEKIFLIISNGQVLDESLLEKEFQSVSGRRFRDTFSGLIATDGAVTNLELLGLKADYLIGDFDSISEDDLIKYRENTDTELVHDPDQSKTDTQLAIELALKLGAEKIYILAATGGRLDHSLSNIFDLKMIPDSVEAYIINEHSSITLIRSSSTFSGKMGDTLSLIPIIDVVSLSLVGLMYKLEDKNVQSGKSLVCNKFSENEAKITFKTGEILVIRAHD